MIWRIAACLAAFLMSSSAIAQQQIALREMGSFHVGGRKVEISG